MSNTLGKNLQHLCFSIIKRPQHQITNTPKHNNTSNHPKSPQSPITTFTKNYNSLFEDITCLTLAPTTFTASSSSVSDSSTDTDIDEAVLGPQTPDLTAAYASRRFFISSPGRSNSIVDYRSSSSSLEDDTDTPHADTAGGVPVETYSPDPYTDFRLSMQEMMEAREVARESVMGAWEYLQELLLSYLTLNPKSLHKYIVRAFADLVVSSMSPIINSDNNGATSSSSSPSFSSYCGVTNNNNNNSVYVEIFNNAS